MINTQHSNSFVTGIASTMGDDFPLNTTTLIRHAARTYPEQEIVYREPDGGWSRYTIGESYERMCRLANALRALGATPGSKIGVLDWNSRRNFELYFAIPGLAAVMVQLNLRLSKEDLSYVVQHSQVSIVFVDETLLSIAEAIAPLCPEVRHWIVMSDKPLSEISTKLSPCAHFESLLAESSSDAAWPLIDEKSAYSACYTTGTTGRPKGVYYSHRAICLHAMAMALSMSMGNDDCAMLTAPMFHAQCWGLPQAATLMATKIVLPGRYAADNIKPLVDILIAEKVTVTNGAPVIFQPMLQYIQELPKMPDLANLRMLCGATEPPYWLVRDFFKLTGARILQAYGATETTPLAVINHSKPWLENNLPADELVSIRRKQGLPVNGVEIKLLGSDNESLPHDGQSIGEICLRGPWITARYHDMPGSEDRFHEGYWRSGDVGTIDEHGYVKLTDRIKDVIKSGGEWISSIDMENAIMGHPSVREAAVIGVPHERWQERPVGLVVQKPGTTLTTEEVLQHLSGSFAKWQLPDRILFVDALPRTSVGKLDKKVMREQHAKVLSQ